MKKTKTRNFTITDYNCDKNFYENIFEETKNGIRYICYGEEVCPQTKRLHYQGYIYFHNPRYLNSVIKLLAPRHVEVCKGSAIDNIQYCSKDGRFTELGHRP